MSSLLAKPAPSRATHAHAVPFWKRQLLIVSRWLHIYLSMASFGILFFFAVTGLTLNHAEWFVKEQRAVQSRGQISPQYLGPQVAKLEIVERLRATGIHGAVKDFRIEDTDCAIAFRGPGYSADIFIDRASGRYEVTETRAGLIAILNDLHKGRDTGSAWAVIIDISAILMTAVALTGMLLICFLHKKRFSGLLAAVAGIILCYLAYLAWVP
jgi:hypothetical protein